MKKIIVIGNGLFGSALARIIRDTGHEALIISDERELSASKCAACLLKPTWLQPSMRKVIPRLEALYGLREYTFDTQLKPIKLNHVPPSAVLLPVDVAATVQDIDHSDVSVRTTDGRVFSGDEIVVCAGVWSKKLVNCKLEGKQGACLVWDRGVHLDPRFHMWAPYKQAIALTRADGTSWFGDGTAIKYENWNEEYERRLVEHAELVGANLPGYKMLRGIRPFGGPDVRMERVSDHVWINSGGGKIGLSLAVFSADYFVQEVGL